MQNSKYFDVAKEMVGNDIRATQHKITLLKVSFCLCILIIVIQLCIIINLVTKEHNYVYVAKVAPGEQLQNLTLLKSYVTPGKAEKIYFIKEYISNFMTLSLDPILARTKMLSNYKVSGVLAKKALNHYIDTTKIIDNVGKEVRTVRILTYNIVSENTFQLTWNIDIFNLSTKKQSIEEWSGLFTLTNKKNKRTPDELLQNPFGIHVDFFSLNKI